MRFKRVILVSICLFFLAALSFSRAQLIPAGKLIGLITDVDKAPLPGVTVTISSPSLILPQMGSVSTERGTYRFISLPSGTYRVTFEMPGMKTIIREGIIIAAGGTTTLDVVMEQTQIGESVVVTGKAPTVDLQKTTAVTVYQKDFVDKLPAPRFLVPLFTQAPGMFDRTSQGSDERSNKYMTDGVIHNEVVNGDPINEVGFNSIEEIVLETSGHNAEFGGVKGAVVQVITKSGGNKFSGDLRFLFRHKKMQSDNTKGTPFEGSYVGFKYQAIPSGSLGGPIIKDKLWFFLSMDHDWRHFYVQGFPAYSDKEVPNIQKTYYPFLKFSWQLSPKDKLIASGYYSGWTLQHRDSGWWTVEDANFNENSGGPLFTLVWTRATKNFLFNLRGNLFGFHQFMIARNELWPVIDIADGIINGGIGSNWWYKKSRVLVNQDATYFADNWLGNHEFKGGLEFQYATNYTKGTYYSDPRFEGVFPDGFYAVDELLLNGVPLQVWVGEELEAKERMMQFSLFAQDTWTPIKHLTVNFGLRYEHSEGYYPRQQKPNTGEWVVEKRITPMKFNTLAPRLGISYDPFGTGKTAIKASYGRYYNPMLLIYILQNNPNQRSSFWAILNPDWTVNYTTPPFIPSLTGYDSDLRAPYMDEITVGITREIIEDMSLSATFIAKWDRYMFDDTDVNHLDLDHWKETGEMNWTGYTPVQGTDPETGQPVTFYEMNEDFGDYSWFIFNYPGTIRKYTGFQVKMNKRLSKRWGMVASWDWGRGVGYLNSSRGQNTSFTGFFDDPNTMINAYGLLDWQRQHMVKIQGTYMAPLGINISAFYFFGTGVPYTRILRSYTAGVDLYQGWVGINAEPRGSQKLPSQHKLDIRLEKDFNLGRGQLTFLVDCYNVFNANTTTGIGATTDVDWGVVRGIMSPRYIMVGAEYKF